MLLTIKPRNLAFPREETQSLRRSLINFRTSFEGRACEEAEGAVFEPRHRGHIRGRAFKAVCLPSSLLILGSPDLMTDHRPLIGLANHAYLGKAGAQ